MCIMGQNSENKEEIDLSKALESSGPEVEPQVGQQQSASSFYPGTPKIIQLVIKCSGGLVKNEKQAQYVLVGLIVLMVIITIVIFLIGSGQPTPNPAPMDQSSPAT